MLLPSHARRSAWPHAFDSASAAATAILVKGKRATSGLIINGIMVAFRANSLSLTSEESCVSLSGTKNHKGYLESEPAKVRILSARSKAFVSDDLPGKMIEANISFFCFSDPLTDMIDTRIYKSYSIFCSTFSSALAILPVFSWNRLLELNISTVSPRSARYYIVEKAFLGVEVLVASITCSLLWVSCVPTFYILKRRNTNFGGNEC